ncbi:hypothetical protein SAMN04487948_13810 [Halogranum amylolyticum]|uniref:Uncharacterized protein n=1 Tax=Halogranum amylolyticum TaxID=660520 RepID=A0A1H8WQZ7_9EURY|nr:hypothetical protein SAMN04487948_13810 [Halogranum amylolyticum]
MIRNLDPSVDTSGKDKQALPLLRFDGYRARTSERSLTVSFDALLPQM